MLKLKVLISRTNFVFLCESPDQISFLLDAIEEKLNPVDQGTLEGFNHKQNIYTDR